MDFKNLDFGSLVSGLAKVATVFNPAVGGGLMVAGSVIDQLDNVDDDFLSNEVIGLSATSKKIDDMIASGNVDIDTLKSISGNLTNLEKLVSKSFLILK